MNTKDKGNISEVAILKSLIKKGYRVSIPWGENCPYDLVFEENGKFYRVQCRTGRIKIKSLTFNLSTTYYDSSAKKSVRRGASNQVDFYGVYTPEDDCCYLVPKLKVLSNKECSLRIEPFSKGREWMANNCLWAKEYLM